MINASQLENVNALIGDFGESVRRFFHDQQRSSQLSPLFNLPGRLILGSYCYYEHLFPLVQQVCRCISPEELAGRMRQLCVRPNYVNLNSLMLGYFNGREQALLLGTACDDDPQEIAFLLDVWSRTARAYRTDGRLLPGEADFTLPILDCQTIDHLASSLHNDFSDAQRRHIRRAIATIDLFTFVLNAEARVGTFHHGPYALPNEDRLVIKEQVGLREDFFSWTDEASQLPVPNLTRVVRVRDLTSKFDLFGTLRTEPKEVEDLIVAQGVFTVDGDEVREISVDQLEALAEQAGDAQMELYHKFTDWNDRQRIEYGAELYANLLRAFGDMAGLGQEFHQEIRKRFKQTTTRHIDSLLEGEPPLVLQHIAQTDGPIYRPVSG